MLTPSVNVVQSSFPEELQGEISGLSRSISNLGSSFGTAIAGTILVSVVATGNRAYAWAMAVARRVRAHRAWRGVAPSLQARAARLSSLPVAPAGLSVLPEVLVHEGDRHAALADCRRDTLHGAESDVAAGEDARDARLEEVRIAVELPAPAARTSGPVSM